MNWDQVTAIIVTILGAGGIGVELIRRDAKDKPPLPREEADLAQAHAQLPRETQIVTAALTAQINSLSKEFNEKLETERRERLASEARLRSRYERLHAWALDIFRGWEIHRQSPTPPPLPEE